MKTRPLILDEPVRAEFRAMLESAKLNCLSLDDVQKAVKLSVAAGDNPALKNQVCELPFGYRVVFTIEELPAPFGWNRHISISVTQDEPGKRVYPHPLAVEAIMECFEFTGGIRGATHIYMEEKWSAINVLQKMEKP